MLSTPPAADAAAGTVTPAVDMEDAANALAEAGKADTPKEAEATEASKKVSGYRLLGYSRRGRRRTQAGMADTEDAAKEKADEVISPIPKMSDN